MTDLAQKYRPQRFADVAGQPKAEAWFRRQVTSKEARSVLLFGPYGTGKTTLGLLYAKALFCEATEDGEPCGTCGGCKGFGDFGRGFPDFQRFECGENSKVEDVKNLVDMARVAPWNGNRRVLMLDEIHNLSRRAFDALLRIVESPPAWAAFIFLTSKPEALPAALRSRLTHLELTLLTSESATRFLIRICQAEGLTYDVPGLALLQAAVGGQPREMLRAIEKVNEFGAISETNVRLALNLDFLERLMAYSHALLDGDLKRQLALMEEWDETPSRKLGFLHQFFVYTFLVGVRHLDRDDPIMRGLATECREKLLHGMVGRACRLHLQEITFWENAIAALAPRDRLSEHEFAMVLSGFNGLMNLLPDPRESQKIVRSVPRAGHKLRIGKAAVGSGPNPGDYLPWREIKPFWEVGSFLPQHYGALLNLRLTIRHAEIGIRNHVAGAELISDLTHELSMRLNEWRPDSNPQFHWMYRHEADDEGHLVTRLMMSVPEDHLTAAVHWIRSRFFARRYESVGFPALTIVLRTSRNPKCLLRFHWACIRALSRSLDPALFERSKEGERLPLIDLLGIPRRWRGPTGTVQCAKRRGASKSLRRSAQRAAAAERMPFLSALEDRAWQAMDGGWELLEHRDRAAEVQRRHEAEGRVCGLFAGDDKLTRARCAEEIARLRARYPLDPKERLRSWEGWWGTGLSSCQPIPTAGRSISCAAVSLSLPTLE
jgi:DNA polymerase-3 subunit gamma/tau